MASFVYNKFKQRQIDGTAVVDFDTDTLKCALLTSTYTPNQDTHTNFSDLTNEVSGSGYTSGGQTISSVSITLDTANDRVDVSGANPTWSNSTLTARYAVIYKSTGSVGTSPIIALIDFGSDQASSAGSFVIQWSTPGFLRLS